MFVAETKPAMPAVSASASTPGSASSWRRIVEPVEPFLALVAQRLAEQVATFEPEIAPYAQYALTNQGKQLRPTLVALSAGRSGMKLEESLIRVAVIIEMIHLATLVHDDVMDEAAVRRRRPTLARSWGNQLSVLLGDCLFAHALKLAAGFPTTEVCRAVASATKTVCSGEIVQTHRQGRLELSRAEYFRILQMKTGELFALSCDLGAWLSGAPETERSALRCYGLSLGTAYQLYDDCVDIFGTEKAAGKSLGTDLANGKLTLPILVALDHATKPEAARLRTLLAAWDARHAPEFLELLDRHNALADSRRVIQSFLDSARQTLDNLGDKNTRRSLTDLCSFLAQQTALLGLQ
jgi:octaprenyl-diphosphate synthase